MPPIDPTLLAAHAIHTSPGVYAILLGSGASSAAGIPTGWAITLDLIRRVATVEDGRAPEELEDWYATRFGGPPDYSQLLDTLGPTQAERQAILRSYIEPTDEERSEGLKLPTEAHRAIAQLAAGGFMRVVLTTNFDRLVEQALTEAGVDFDVMSTVDGLRGARPLGQAPCAVIKLHGDYRDSRILNTEAELKSYGPEFDALLDRTLDEHGLVVVGWSASWDPALRAAITRQPNRRYNTWWVRRGELTSEAADIISARKATVIETEDANTFFIELAGKVEALSELDRPHPLSVATAIAELKTYLPDPTRRLRLRDLVIGDANRVHDVISDNYFPVDPPTLDKDSLRNRIARYEAHVEILLAMFSVGGAWANDAGPWADALERVANTSSAWNGKAPLLSLRRYPALLCVYAGGIAATHSSNWPFLRATTTDAIFADRNERVPIATALNQWEVFQAQCAQWLPGQERNLTPVSNRLFDILRDPLRDTIPVDERYEETFDRFEYLLGLIIQDQQNLGVRHHWQAPVGCFAWRHQYGFAESGNAVGEKIRAEAEAAGTAWPPLQSGIFGGVVDRYGKAEAKYREIVKHLSSGWL